MNAFTVYTDGSCSGNPGPGGWAALVLVDRKLIDTFTGSRELTTNNRMELIAVGSVLRKLPDGAQVDIHTDSQLIIGLLSLGWKRKDATLKNYCERIEAWIAEHRQVLTFNKVKGHADDFWNNEADKMAREACRKGIRY